MLDQVLFFLVLGLLDLRIYLLNFLLHFRQGVFHQVPILFQFELLLVQAPGFFLDFFCLLQSLQSLLLFDLSFFLLLAFSGFGGQSLCLLALSSFLVEEFLHSLALFDLSFYFVVEFGSLVA